MATYTDPTTVHTPATGQVAPAAWGTAVNTDLGFFYNAPTACAYNSAGLTISSGALTALTQNSERWDNDGIHSTSVNTSRHTIVTAGVYEVEALVTWGDAHADGRQFDLRVNGVTAIRVVNNAETNQYVRRRWKFAAGDYVEAFATQASGSNKTATPEMAVGWASAG